MTCSTSSLRRREKIIDVLTIWASALISLRQVRAGPTVVARFRSTVVKVDFAVATREASWTVAPGFVALSNAKSSILAEVRAAFDVGASRSFLGTNFRRLLVRSALEARGHSFRELEEVSRAWRTWFEAGFRITSWTTLGCKKEVNFSVSKRRSVQTSPER